MLRLLQYLAMATSEIPKVAANLAADCDHWSWLILIVSGRPIKPLLPIRPGCTEEASHPQYWAI
jgi:hypothetical protein